MDDDDSDEYGFEYGISVLGGGNVDSGDFIARAELIDEWCGHPLFSRVIVVGEA